MPGRKALYAGVVILLVFLALRELSRTPDLSREAATAALKRSPEFLGRTVCIAGGDGDVEMHRHILRIHLPERHADSEADCCYSARVYWRWESDDHSVCRDGREYQSSAEYRYSTSWEFFELNPDGTEPDPNFRP